jgi:DNA-binding response OmpR family regulator
MMSSSAVCEPFRVLVVEDDPTSRDALRDLIELEGYVVETAARGDAALLQQRAAPPDLLLTDLHLPGLDGLSLARLARQETNCAILVMSGSEWARHAELEFELVEKPIDLDRLLAQMRRVLAAR